jgi:hypothetical protein
VGPIEELEGPSFDVNVQSPKLMSKMVFFEEE